MSREDDIVKASATAVKPSGYLDYKPYLEALYAHVKAAHEGDYSWQRFADSLGFGATTAVHQIVRGHRPLTKKAAEKMIPRLGLTGVERRYLLAMVAHAGAKTAAARQEAFEDLLSLKERVLPDEIDKDTLAYYSEWYHPVLRELVGSEGIENDAEKIAGRIVPRLRPEQVRESLALLLRLGLISFDEEAKLWRQTTARVSTGSRVRGLALVGYHKQMIERASEALATVPGKRRDVSAMTVCVSEEAMPRLRALIHAFQSQLLDEAEKNPGDEVYQVNVQLFPFTDGRKKAE